ncbi:MAG: DivIVA family protein [Herbinix sp.]|jgi:cell division initiation protein|nr:DivIVA family protein [Herbinix sp.]
MFTPSEIQEKEFKTGIGYDKKEVEQFLKELTTDYETLLNENESLKRKMKDASDSLGYYKSIEKTLQKALILAEKTAQDTRATALREADATTMEARVKANLILEDARKQIEFMEHKTLNLMQQYDMFKIHFENLLHAQIELINSKSFSVNTDDFRYKEPEEPMEAFDQVAATEVATDQEIEPTTELSKQYDEELEDLDQIIFDFLEEPEEKNYKTEDGFEFFTMKDES